MTDLRHDDDPWAMARDGCDDLDPFGEGTCDAATDGDDCNDESEGDQDA